MKRLIQLVAIVLIPVIGFCEEPRYLSTAQPAPSGQFLRVMARNLPWGEAQVMISVMKNDKEPVAAKAIQQVQVFTPDGRAIEYIDNNPGELGPPMVSLGSSAFTATYILTSVRDYQVLGRVTFRYQDHDYVFVLNRKSSLQ